MRVEYTVSEDDFVAAGKLALKTRSRWYSAQRIYFPVMGAIIIAITLIDHLHFAQDHTKAILPLLLGAFFLWIGFATPWNLRRQYRKMPILANRRVLEADDQGLHFVSRSSDSRTTWEPYSQYGEDQTSFILFQQGRRIFIPIPKREFEPQQVDQLRELLQAHLTRK